MDALSFTAGTDDRLYAATMTGFGGGSADTLRDIIASNRTTVLEADDDDVAIGSASNAGDRIVVIMDADSERSAPQWSAIEGIGAFSGSFIINCNGSGWRRGLRID